LAARRRAVHVRLRAALSQLTGTRSFHNFSPKRFAASGNAADPASVRTVYRCRCGMTSGYADMVVAAEAAAPPTVKNALACADDARVVTGSGAGCAMAVLVITGRSFLYHQILGMVGLVIASVSGAVPPDYIELALSAQAGVEVPLAPAAGLVLAGCYFKDKACVAPAVSSWRATTLHASAHANDEEEEPGGRHHPSAAAQPPPPVGRSAGGAQLLRAASGGRRSSTPGESILCGPC
jgi:tRNA U38,U39,U40 pseudouridine synthase TruA